MPSRNLISRKKEPTLPRNPLTLNEDACELAGRGLREIGQGEIREIHGRRGGVEIGIDRRTLL